MKKYSTRLVAALYIGSEIQFIHCGNARYRWHVAHMRVNDIKTNERYPCFTFVCIQHQVFMLRYQLRYNIRIKLPVHKYYITPRLIAYPLIQRQDVVVIAAFIAQKVY